MTTRLLVVLVVAACAACAVWLMLARGGGDAQRAAARASLFAPGELPLERITRITLERPGTPTIVFERAAGEWVQTAPAPHPGDASMLREVIDTAAALEQSREVDIAALSGDARSTLGLEPPRAVLTLAWPEGERAIELGRRTVAGRAWARVRGRDSAASVGATLHELAIDGDPRQWRSLALYDASAGEPERLAITLGGTGDTPWVLERTQARWAFTSPVATRADGEAVRAYIEAIARAQADAAAADHPGDGAAFGLAPAPFRVEVRHAGGATSTVEIGNPVTQGAVERFGRVDGRATVLQVGAKALATLFPPPTQFVDPRGSDVIPADVRAVTITPALGRTEQPFTLERARDAWLLRVGERAGPQGAAGDSGAAGTQGAPGEAVAANADAVRRLLGQLTETRANAVAFNPLPPDLVLADIVLEGEGGRVLGVVRVAREAQGRWALDNRDGVLRVFPEGFDVRLDAASYGAR